MIKKIQIYKIPTHTPWKMEIEFNNGNRFGCTRCNLEGILEELGHHIKRNSELS